MDLDRIKIELEVLKEISGSDSKEDDRVYPGRIHRGYHHKLKELTQNLKDTYGLDPTDLVPGIVWEEPESPAIEAGP